MTKEKEQSFAKAFEELEGITRAFESGKFDLDEGLVQFERGLALAALLKKKLAAVESRVEVIKKKFTAEDNVEKKEIVSKGKSVLTSDDDTLPF